MFFSAANWIKKEHYTNEQASKFLIGYYFEGYESHETTSLTTSKLVSDLTL